MTPLRPLLSSESARDDSDSSATTATLRQSSFGPSIAGAQLSSENRKELSDNERVS